MTITQLLNLGFWFFPLRSAKDKSPRDRGWQQQSTRDLRQIRKWLDQGPLGVDCGASDLTVIDVDSEKAWAHAAEQCPALPPTFEVRTPSGGRHLYFRGTTRTLTRFVARHVPGWTKADAEKHGDCDIRSTGGLVVAPTNGNGYEVTSVLPLAPLPDTWVQIIGQRPEAGPAEAVIDQPDQPEYVERARTWLSQQPALSEGSRDDTVWRLAADLKNLGLSRQMAEGVLLDWFDDQPQEEWREPFTQDDVCQKLDSAYRRSREPLGSRTPEGAAALARQKLAAATAPATELPVVRASDVDPAGIPRREWLLHHRLLRRYVTATIAPGATGKSTYVTLEALALATGQDLTGQYPTTAANVWLINGEDPQDELQMRIHGAARDYGIHPARLDRLWVSSGRDHDYRLVEQINDAVFPRQGVIDQMRRFIREQQIDVLILDPLIQFHGADENSNSGMQAVARVLTDIAHDTNCGVSIIHHSRKRVATDGAGDAESARGASALIDAVRLAHTVTKMDADAAERLHVPEEDRNWYVRLDDAKVNLAPPASRVRWFRFRSVTLPNLESVGVLHRHQFENPQQIEERLYGAVLAYMDQQGVTCVEMDVLNAELTDRFGSAVEKLSRLVERPAVVGSRMLSAAVDHGRTFVSIEESP